MTATVELPPVIGVGASAGGVEALTALVGRLPTDLPAAVFVVLHVSPAGTSVLAQILDRAGPLPALTATHGGAIEPGTIYVAPADRHLMIAGGILCLSVGPRENGHRPAVDPLFRSLAAETHRPVGVILSGTRDDGTQGLERIKSAGGLAIVQDPDEALYDGMPRSAIENVGVDAVLPVADIAHHLTHLLSAALPMTEAPDNPGRPALEKQADDLQATRYTCPDCGGALWRSEEGSTLRFTCSVGHAYSPDSLDDEQAEDVESALWAATRLLGDRATLLDEMAERARGNGHLRSANLFAERSQDATEAARVLRGLIESGRVPTAGGTNDEA